jgi:hypothetical protein
MAWCLINEVQVQLHLLLYLLTVAYIKCYLVLDQNVQHRQYKVMLPI